MDPYHIGNSSHELGDWLAQPPAAYGDSSLAPSHVIEGLLGSDHAGLTREHADYLAASNGWGHPTDSSALHDAGQMLDAMGVPHHRVDGATVEQVLGELQDGQRVVVSVPGEHAAAGSPLEDFLHSLHEGTSGKGEPLHAAPRAVAVKGVDRSDPAHPQILLADPRQPNGPVAAYPLDAFSEAMKDQDLSFLATPAAGTPHPPQGEPAKEHSLIDELAGNATGLVAAGLTLHLTGMPGLAVAAGKVVEEATDALWDSIMKSA